ncbi:MAG: MFS transporter [Aristaeellaceae bacterium]
MKKPRLWTRDFSCITVTTILSAIGGEALNLPVSLLVFDETGSTLAAALIMVCGMLPDVILPIFVAPLIDRSSKKPWVVTLDVLQAAVLALMGWWIGGHPFSFPLYLFFTLVVGTISVFYRLAFQAWYPDLIPVGAEQQGYAVASTIYPVISIAMAPVAAFLYEKVAMSVIFEVTAALILMSVLAEVAIRERGAAKQDSYSFRQYREDIADGFRYLRREKGVRNIYCYMAVTNGASNGNTVLMQAFFQTAPWLGVTLFGLTTSAEMLGRTLGGLVQYKVQIPVKKRFTFTKFVYGFYTAMEAIVLLLPYPLILLNRFLCGALGVTSATIRESAMQSYLQPDMRARVNALFNVIFSLGGILCQLLAGGLGQVMDYRLAVLILCAVNTIAMLWFIVRPGKDNRPIYEATRAA